MKTIETTHRVAHMSHVDSVIECTRVDIETLALGNTINGAAGDALPPGSFHVTITWEPDAPTPANATRVSGEPSPD